MKNEKVISLASDGKDIYGLTETGKFVYFDKQASSFVLKSEGAVLSMDRAYTIKKQDGPVFPDSKHQGRYRDPKSIEIKPPSRIKTMVTPVNVAIGLVALAIALYWFVK